MTTGSASRAVAVVRERGGVELAERLAHLDARRGERRADLDVEPPDPEARPDVDVAFVGGGLSLLVAAELSRLGMSVAVVDRARSGQAHREWNASEDELSPLVESGIATEDELRRMTVARYREGFCAFHGGERRRVRGVLDHAIDAGPFLARVRAVCEARGVRFVDGASVSAIAAGSSLSRVVWQGAELVARVAVDARGASSPWATADLVCPTVGGVLRGLEEGSGPRAIDPGVGEILVTTEDADAASGRQHVWEAFPGRAGETTVYLFYYGRSATTPGGALAELYARFFETLATYKSGDAELVRPTFGYIPGWSRLTPAPTAPSPRIVLVGDAAARHSALTFCGFGAMLRAFRPAAARIARAVAEGRAPPAGVVDEDPIHAWTGALASLMASGTLRGAEMNGLLDAAFGVLEEMGNDAYAALLKDRMAPRDFMTFLQRTASRRPSVYRDVLRSLGPTSSARWALRVAKERFA
jgi:lycopene cyclase CruA